MMWKWRIFCFVGLLIWMSLQHSWADTSESYRQGEALAREHKALLKGGHPSSIPAFTTDKPRESAVLDLNRVEQGAALQEKVRRKLISEQADKKSASHLLIETEQKRTRFKIDPKTDPLLQQADEIIHSSEKVLNLQVNDGAVSLPIQKTEVCYESGEPQIKHCVMKRHVALKEIPRQKHVVTISRYRHAYGGPLYMNVVTSERLDPDRYYRGPEHAAGIHVHANAFPKELIPRVVASKLLSGPFRLGTDHILHCANGNWFWHYGTVEIDYRPLPREEDLIESIEDTCGVLEEGSNQGHCTYGEEKIIEGPETRVFDTLSVKRDWWHKERTYMCRASSANNCKPLRDQGCVQTNSTCHRKEGERCVEWQQTFLCTLNPSSLKKSSFKGEHPFCLDGKCAGQSWTPNQDMADSLAKMSLLKEMKKEMADFKEGRIFKGDDMKCSKHCLNFSDCCSLNNGWGETMKMTQCGAEEQLLAQKRREGKCHLVGTYCAKKVLKQCVMKKTSFCCYGSKLARVLHEQGRAQLGIGWGEAEHPQCRALSVSEFSKIDFSRVNLSEVLSDVMRQVKVPNMAQTTQKFQENWKARLPHSQDMISTAQPQAMTHQISERQQGIRAQKTAGAYSLHESPPLRPQREETKPQVVF